MTPKTRFTQSASRLIISALLAIAFFTSSMPVSARAMGNSSNLPEFSKFVEQVKNGNADMLRGVYVPNVMAFSVVQQPTEDTRFISTKPAEVTEFSMAAKMGNVGLLAHNSLAGKVFFNVTSGNLIVLVYGDGSTQSFVVEKILQYQVLPYGQFKDLQTQNTVGVGELFNIAYGGDYHVTLQTCIERDGNLEWGRFFIIAKPVAAK